MDDLMSYLFKLNYNCTNIRTRENFKKLLLYKPMKKESDSKFGIQAKSELCIYVTNQRACSKSKPKMEDNSVYFLTSERRLTYHFLYSIIFFCCTLKIKRKHKSIQKF